MLSRIDSPADLRALALPELERLAAEIRGEIIKVTHVNGGHLGAPLGVVELAIALHYVYDFSTDRLVWDVGHQIYPHKLLTGRKAMFPTLRTFGGLSGFPSTKESSYDLFTTGHAGTSISAGLGLARGAALLEEDRRVVSVIGDASLGSGVAFEALNDAGHTKRNMLVILNDNGMSISHTVGALAKYLSRVRMSPRYENVKREIHHLIESIPFIGERLDRGIEGAIDTVKNILVPGHVFEALGHRYYGPHDGHDLEFLIETLRSLKDVPGLKLLHLITQKGRGLPGAEQSSTGFHGVNKGAVIPKNGFVRMEDLSDHQRCAIEKAQTTSGGKAIGFANVFSDTIVQLAEQDRRVVAITAAMPDGTGLLPFQKKFPDRFFDTGITEQHAVALASGLAVAGIKPFVAIYSTFLQRAYDQVFQEVALQGNHVIFCLSHGGLVGEDGPTHHGLFDIAFLRALPNLVLLSPRDGAELRAMLQFALGLNGPVAIRYPKGGCGVADRAVVPLELGQPEVLQDGPDGALVGYGPMAEVAMVTAELLARDGLAFTVVNARFAKPLDQTFYATLSRRVPLLVTLEDAAQRGGFGSAVLESLAEDGDAGKVRVIGVPDRFIEHGSNQELLDVVGMTPEKIVLRVKQWLARR
ncbi:MAG: 1-deoxy-D-xylulose-5-phosphate synthase [Planctomycetota bacterium]